MIYNFLFLKFIVLIFMVLISVAFMTLLERKFLSLTGIRMGPNKVSFMGILQPIYDAIKLSNKSSNYVINSTLIFYFISCLGLFFSSLMVWTCNFNESLSISYKFSALVFLIFLGFNSMYSIFCGWSCFGKYSIIGSLRTVSQLISYEACLYLCLFFFFFMYGVYNFYDFNFMFGSFMVIMIPICFFIWVPSMLAELNRTPYDFSEGESELVSGFNTEFGSLGFTLIFLSEYMNIIFFCSLTSFLFMKSFFIFYLVSFIVFIIWIRAVLPRFRFDKLMYLAWKFFIPFMTIYFILFFTNIF